MNLERKWIERIQTILGANGPGVLVGIGDDAAVLDRPAGKMVVTTDCLVEGVHFDLSYCTAREVGHKALVVNLSDIAAMGASPRFALVSLALPSPVLEAFIPGFYQGLKEVALRFGVEVVGGNLSRSSDKICVDIFLLGEMEGQPVLRSTARVGDQVGVIGVLGEAAAGLKLLQQWGREKAFSQWPGLCQAQLVPEPLVEAGQLLATRGLATSLIDVSDGLVNELSQIAKASAVSIEIEEKNLPISEALRNGAKQLGLAPEEWVLNGGEDYSLLFSFSRDCLPEIQRAFGARFCAVGHVIEGEAGEVWAAARGQRRRLLPAGFIHFA